MEDQEEKLLRNRVELAVRATTRINKCDPLSCCRFWWFWWLLYWFAVSVLAIDYMLGVPYIHVQNYSPNALLQKKLGTASSTPVMIAAESVQKTSVMVADEKFKGETVDSGGQRREVTPWIMTSLYWIFSQTTLWPRVGCSVVQDLSEATRPQKKNLRSAVSLLFPFLIVATARAK